MTTFTDGVHGSLKISDKKCDRHGCHFFYLSSAPERLSCPKCQREVVERNTKKMVQEAIETDLKRESYNWLYNRSVILEKKLIRATFDNYRGIDEETIKNKEMALKFAREYYKEATYNTIFTGKAGTGKSHLAMAMLKIVNEHSRPYKKCLFISIDELLSLIKDSFRNKESKFTELMLTDLLTEADLLVLDDLGAEVGSMNSDKEASDFVTKVLKKVFDGRDEKPTIITTNLTSSELKEKYDQRILSRMNKGVLGEVKHSIQFKETTDKRLYDTF